MMIDTSWKTDTGICFLPYILKIYCFSADTYNTG